MPTISNMNLPTPKSWDEFEEITLDPLKIKWDSPNLQRHGRRGQSQNGIDIYGEDYLSQHVGVQCKKYDLELKKSVIEEEITKAERFQPAIKIFFIATTQPTDAKLQKDVRLISKDRTSIGKFAVSIFFWDDIVQELVTNEKNFRKHFPQISIEMFKINTKKRLFSFLDLGYLGLNLEYYCDVIFGEFGQMAQEDPRKINIICSVIKSACLSVCSNEEQIKINLQIDRFLNYLEGCYKQNESKKFYWEESHFNANGVAVEIKSLEHSLSDNQLLAFRVGEILSSWNRYEFYKKIETPFPDENLVRLKSFTTKLNNNFESEDISSLIDNYKKNYTDIRLAIIVDKVYNKVRQTLIEVELIG